MKITSIRTSLNATATAWYPENSTATSYFSEFSPITVNDIILLIGSCPTKTPKWKMLYKNRNIRQWLRRGGGRMNMVRSARALIGWKKWPVEALRDAKASNRSNLTPKMCPELSNQKVTAVTRRHFGPPVDRKALPSIILDFSPYIS